MIDLTPLYAEIEKRKLSHERIAEMCGMHFNTVRRTLHGENVYIDTLETGINKFGFELVLQKKSKQ